VALKYIIDKTGRFSQRPFYTEDELDSECESIISAFLLKNHGKVEYPVSTDDITKLIESEASDLDLYADLSKEGHDVEGVTEFWPKKKPSVKISKNLSENDNQKNRLRTTLTHEYGHLKFHGHLVALDYAEKESSFLSNKQPLDRFISKRENILNAPKIDWMEWQAGYICGALLMPRNDLIKQIQSYREVNKINGDFIENSEDAENLISMVTLRYEVSREAARIRLLKLNILKAPTNQLQLI
jgi:Zn-dependent peptidase ImmA (M78 family)